MNIGLIILVTSLFLGAEDNNTGHLNEIKNPNSELITTNEEVDKNNTSSNQSDEESQIITVFNESVNNINSPPTIKGEPRQKINQDEYYSFTPLVNDPENDKLVFDISNKPQWAVFDNRTGTLFGQPTNDDIGISKNVTITVRDQIGVTTLVPFNIEVININDGPTISGIPRLFFTIGKIYNFTPKVYDIDLDIGKDKHVFSIQNKPSWAKFNVENGQLSGKPKVGNKEYAKNIIITVTDRYGLSDSLEPFDLTVYAETEKPNADITISQITENLFTSNKIIKTGLLVDSTNIKSNVITVSSDQTITNLNEPEKTLTQPDETTYKNIDQSPRLRFNVNLKI
jgi:hypothetical protein